MNNDNLNPSSNRDSSNAGQQLALAERQSAENAHPPKGDEASPKEAEQTSTSSDSWSNNLTDKKDNSPAKGKINWRKGGGATGLVGGGLLVGTLGMGILFGPMALLSHMSEVFIKKFNVQVAAMQEHAHASWMSKIRGKACTGGPMKCKFKTLSQKQLTKLDKAGFKVYGADGALIKPGGSGRVSMDQLEFPEIDGKPGPKLNAGNMTDELAANKNLRRALKGVYNPRFAGFADRTFTKVMGRLKTHKGKSIKGKNKEERMKSIADNANDGPAESNGKNKIDTTETDADGNNKYKDSDIDKANKANKAASEIEAGAKDVATKGRKAVSGAMQTLKGGVMQKVKGFISLDGGIMDYYCGVYNAASMVNYGAKTIRAVQLGRFAMEFVKVGSQIRDGTVKKEDVEAMGEMATKIMVTQAVIKATNKPKRTKAATDSFGYKYAAYNQLGAMPESASAFLAGGVMSGVLSGLMQGLNSGLLGNARSTCKAVRHPVTQILNMAGGLALAFFTGGGTKIAGAIGAKAVSQVMKESMKTAIKTAAKSPALYAQGAFELAIMLLPNPLADLLAGKLVDDSTAGEDAGDAWTSGSSHFMGLTAFMGGNAPLTREEAAAYDKQREEEYAAYVEEETAAASFFDMANPYSFSGSIMAKMAPSLIKMRQISSGALTGTMGVVNALFSSSLKDRYAKASGDLSKEFDYCISDEDYNELNIAVDPFCNPRFGLPVFKDVDSTLDYMINEGHISGGDETGNPTSPEFTSFKNNCINREEPLGSVGEDGDMSGITDGSECLLKHSEATPYFYNYIQYERIEDGMEGLDFNKNGSQMSGGGGSAAPEHCKSLPADDRAQAACHTYQFDGYPYLWGGGHGGSAEDWMAKWNSGAFPPGTPILDCSGLVRMAIYSAFGIDIGGGGSDSYPSYDVFEEVPISEGAPGDVWWKTGHVEIVVENHQGERKFTTFGAHSKRTPNGLATKSYDQTQKILRLKRTTP